MSQERKPVMLTDAERADIRHYLKQCEIVGELKASELRRVDRDGTEPASAAARLRVLIALLALLCGCEPFEQRPPPYYVYFASDVPQADRESWGAAAGEWNAAVGGEPVFWVGSEPARGRCGVEIRQVPDWDGESPASTGLGECLSDIEYARGSLLRCRALHELAHVILGRGHIAGTVLAERGCEAPVELERLAAMAREKWGL